MEFPQLEIIQQPNIKNHGEMLKSEYPTFHYNESILRNMWIKIREILDTNKVPVNLTEIQISGQKLQNKIQVNLSSQEEVLVVINNTFHPSWYESNNKPLYAVTPFNQLIFTNHDVELNFKRNYTDKVGLWISAITLMGLFGFSIIDVLKRNRLEKG